MRPVRVPDRCQTSRPRLFNVLSGTARQLGPSGPTCANKDRGLVESAPLPGPILQTAAQNDQLCAAELEITNQATAAPVPG